VHLEPRLPRPGRRKKKREERTKKEKFHAARRDACVDLSSCFDTAKVASRKRAARASGRCSGRNEDSLRRLQKKKKTSVCEGKRAYKLAARLAGCAAGCGVSGGAMRDCASTGLQS
jgi:hypothetical protein